jgi:hypothetical protein
VEKDQQQPTIGDGGCHRCPPRLRCERRMESSVGARLSHAAATSTPHHGWGGEWPAWPARTEGKKSERRKEGEGQE